MTIPFNITTKAGQALWYEMNEHYGSSVWGPVGQGLVDAEEEVRGSIISDLLADCNHAEPNCYHRKTIELIRGNPQDSFVESAEENND
jgi:hypothetical protein